MKHSSSSSLSNKSELQYTVPRLHESLMAQKCHFSWQVIKKTEFLICSSDSNLRSPHSTNAKTDKYWTRSYWSKLHVKTNLNILVHVIFLQY